MDDSKLGSLPFHPSVVVVGIPECWLDARRVAQLLRPQPANDNGRGNAVAASSRAASRV
jgi:hypothetical protein